jgi:hypothetical protein
MTIKEQVSAIGEAFARGLRCILGHRLYALYIFGAVAFPGDAPAGDIDFHAVLTDPLTDDERSQIFELHDSLARDFPPLGGETDGYYILLADARRTSPPRSQMGRSEPDMSFALHREHLRAGRCIVLHGPHPKEIYPPATRSEIEEALAGELQYVEDHLDDYPDYCILQLCLLIYTHETGDVVISKAQASEWARDALPAWGRHIELAWKSYARQATPQDRQFILAEVGRFLEFARARMEWARTGGQSHRLEDLTLSDRSESKPVLELRISLTVQDYDQLLELYSAGLGIAPMKSWSDGPGRGAIFEMGQATLELFDEQQAATVDQIEAGRRVSGPVRLAMQVSDLASAIDRMVAKGATLVHPPVITPWGQHNARLQTPDGMQITLYQD